MVEKNYSRVEVGDIKLGIRFSAPVFFEDGENMFLSAKNPVKKYHLEALKRWKIPFLLTEGYVLSDKEISNIASEKSKAESLNNKMEEVDASFFGIVEDD